MDDGNRLYTTPRVRCLVYQKRLTDDIYMTLCGIERCRPNYKFQTSNRPGYHLHVILEGRGKLCVNGKTNDLHFGQMFITKPNEPVWYQADNDDPWYTAG